MVTFQQVFDAANQASYILNSLGYDINSNQNNIAFGIRKAADKFIFEAGDIDRLDYAYEPAKDDQWANAVQQVIVGVIAEHNKNNVVAFTYIFHKLAAYDAFLHPDEEIPDNTTLDDLFAEIAGTVLSSNSNMPYTWVSEHSSTHTQIGVLAYAARAISQSS